MATDAQSSFPSYLSPKKHHSIFAGGLRDYAKSSYKSKYDLGLWKDRNGKAPTPPPSAAGGDGGGGGAADHNGDVLGGGGGGGGARLPAAATAATNFDDDPIIARLYGQQDAQGPPATGAMAQYTQPNWSLDGFVQRNKDDIDRRDRATAEQVRRSELEEKARFNSECSFHPEINQASQQLVADTREPGTVHQKLWADHSVKVARMEERQLILPAFRPEMNYDALRNVEGKLSSQMEIFLDPDKTQRLEEEHEAFREKEELLGCTFMPEVTDTSVRLAEKQLLRDPAAADLSVYDRQHLAGETLLKKKAALRKALRESEEAKLTFQPALSKSTYVPKSPRKSVTDSPRRMPKKRLQLTALERKRQALDLVHKAKVQNQKGDKAAVSQLLARIEAMMV